MHRILALALLVFSNVALSQDILETGQFAVVHTDGHVTNKIFRVVNGNGKWRVENKKENGNWEDVTCEIDCILSKSQPNQIAEFFHNKPLGDSEVECVHNQAFAFCTLLTNSVKTNVLVAFTPQSPVHVPLKKLGTE